MPVGRGGGVNSVRVKGRENWTVTVSFHLMFPALVAPATATPD